MGCACRRLASRIDLGSGTGRSQAPGWRARRRGTLEPASRLAQELGLTEAAVRGRLRRMRQKFCDLVEELGLSHLRLPTEDDESEGESDDSVDTRG